MNHEVKGCKDCLFEYELQGCFHPKVLKDDDFYTENDYSEYMDAMNSKDEDAAPSWCPLREEPITITKKP